MIATIAIGIATMIAVVGISASGKAKLMRDLDRLGTNMPVVTPGQSMFSDKEVKLPKSAPAMVGRIDGVEHSAARRLGICPESSSEPRPPTSTPTSPRCRGRYPPGPWQAAFGAALVIGTIAGLCPAVRASRMSPTLAPHAS
ncbi:hypothetical protein [Streptomyces scopuliridis]|uniref:hypothetical protein n=1 Tax=Streptomyces scopuliridis TaxID=452529 RepID=UPI0035E00F1D